MVEHTYTRVSNVWASKARSPEEAKRLQRKADFLIASGKLNSLTKLCRRNYKKRQRVGSLGGWKRIV